MISSLMYWWANRRNAGEIDRGLPEFNPPTISKKETVDDVVNTPMSEAYLWEVEENEKCAPICGDYTKNNAFIKAMEFSATAQRLGIDNTMPKEFRQNALALKREILDPLMVANSDLSYRVTSGFRNDRVNSEVGGAQNSLHRFAQAFDVVFYRNGARVPPIEVARIVKILGLTTNSIGVYGTFTHFDYIIGGSNNGSVWFHSSHTGERRL